MNEVDGILKQAEDGNVEIVVSTLAIAEVAYLDGFTDQAAEQRIREFFSRDYIVVAGVDERVGEIAQSIVRKYRFQRRVNPRDAIHLATAVNFGIPVVETSDEEFWFFNELEGSPLVLVRAPLYEGNIPMPGV